MGFWRSSGGPVLATKPWLAPTHEQQESKALAEDVKMAHLRAQAQDDLQFRTRDFINWSLSKSSRRRSRGDAIRAEFDAYAAGRNARQIEETSRMSRSMPGNRLEQAADAITSGATYGPSLAGLPMHSHAPVGVLAGGNPMATPYGTNPGLPPVGLPRLPGLAPSLHACGYHSLPVHYTKPLAQQHMLYPQRPLSVPPIYL